ncbi:exo-alpha-sialidase [Anatilimnocola aggregata]|nr:exo-alpha-sialidase [Anatilimnocola aggregata]
MASLPRIRVLNSKLIWDAAPHNAFTDLIRWKDRWYCSFREGIAHASYDGKVRILRSEDGKTWESLVQFTEEGHDLRDPKLCVLPDGRLLVGMGDRTQDTKNPLNWRTVTRVSVTADGERWDKRIVGDPQVWMWRFVTHGDYVYSFGYCQRPKGLGGETFLVFYRSRDGLEWERIVQTEAGGGYVNEAAFAFQPDSRCVVLLRREGGQNRLGLSRPPYKDWTWQELNDRFNGPALIQFSDGRLLVGGRAKPIGAGSAKTALAWLSIDPPNLSPALTLPSQHETGYPGLHLFGKELWTSYYSSESGKCSIYIARLDVTYNAK